jgi:cytochrome c biogenesis protein CcdA
MAEASFAAAFLAGVLSLLAPCSALLLPAFFAYAFASRTELFGRTLLFLAGLCTVFVPLGLGVSLVSTLLLDARETTLLLAGLLLIGFGLLELTGHGFNLLPPALAARLGPGRSAAAIYATGLAYGLSGFCAGPLLAAVLAIAATAPHPLIGAGLLVTYALGTAAPLFALAWFWDRYQLGRRGWLRGRPLQLGPLRLHSTNLLAGLLFIGFGLTFITTQGGSILSGLYADLGLVEIEARGQLWLAEQLARLPDSAWLLIAMLLAATASALARARGLRISGFKRQAEEDLSRQAASRDDSQTPAQHNAKTPSPPGRGLG